MANAYYDYVNGSAGNDGLTATTAKATRDQAVAVAGAGDKVIAVNGTQQHESADFVFDDDRIESAESFRDATLIAANSETGEVARTSSALLATNNPLTIENLVFDASQGNPPTRALSIVADTSEDIITVVNGCQMIPGTDGALYISDRRGEQIVTDLLITGTINDHAVYVDGNQTASGDQKIKINNLTILPDNELITSQELVDLRGLASNNLDLVVNNLSITADVADSASSVYGIKLKSNSKIHVNNTNLIFNGDDVSGVTGLMIHGHSAGNEPSEVYVQNLNVEFNCVAGYGAAIGESQIDSHLTSGFISGCYLKGKYYASGTPHTLVLGQGSNLTLAGNYFDGGGVPCLVSITDDAKVINNIFYNPFITGIFVKGTTDCTIQNNIVMNDGSYLTRASLLCAVDDQGGTNTAAATIKDNIVYVADISTINTLSAINDTSQVCTYENNIYVLPDDTDLSTTDLFGYNCGAGGAANNTYAEWIAQSEVTDDRIVLLPAAEIRSIIANLQKPDPFNTLLSINNVTIPTERTASITF